MTEEILAMITDIALRKLGESILDGSLRKIIISNIENRIKKSNLEQSTIIQLLSLIITCTNDSCIVEIN